MKDLDTVIAAVGPRVRELRRRRGMTLTTLSERTDTTVSTLSRLESGQRRPGLELLLPVAEAQRVPLRAGVGLVEFLSIVGPQGERFHTVDPST